VVKRDKKTNTTLRTGDVLVLDANVFLDALSRIGLPRESAAASAEALDLVKQTCARVGVTGRLKEHYLDVLQARGPYRPFVGSAYQFLAQLQHAGKLVPGNRSASRCDESSRGFRSFREDGFLLHDAHATGARFIVTKDPRIPKGDLQFPLRRGGRLRVLVIEPEDLLPT